jgi:hypothetical protein
MNILRGTRVIQIIAGVFIGLTLLPLGMYIPNPGTDADRVKLDRLVGTMEAIQRDCKNPELRNLLGFTSQQYRYISRWNVRIVDWGDLGIAGMNWPHLPGMTLDRWFWDECDDNILIGLMLHEAMHDYYPYFGHDHMRHIVSVELGNMDNLWGEFLRAREVGRECIVELELTITD